MDQTKAGVPRFWAPFCRCAIGSKRSVSAYSRRYPGGESMTGSGVKLPFENRGLDDIQAQALSLLKLGRAAKSIGERLSSIHHSRVLAHFR